MLEPVKRATAETFGAFARVRGLNRLFGFTTWGLRPRLYSDAHFAG